MSDHSITRAEYDLYVNTDAATLRASAEFNAIGSEQEKSNVLAWSMDRNREQLSMIGVCIAQVYAYPSTLKTLQIAVVAMSKLVRFCAHACFDDLTECVFLRLVRSLIDW